MNKISDEIDQKISNKVTTSKDAILDELSTNIDDRIDARINVKFQEMIDNNEFPQLPQPAAPPIQDMNESPNTARTRIAAVVTETLTDS